MSIAVLLLISCGEKEKIVEVPVPSACKPAPPGGVYSVNLDGRVKICWYANYETDVEGYVVYRTTCIDCGYDSIGTVEACDPNTYECCFYDEDTGNGVNYLYGVSAFNQAYMSDLIVEEIVSGTPRPESEATLYSYNNRLDACGFDLSGLNNERIPFNTDTTDFYFRITGEPGHLVRQLTAFRDSVDIQDYGYISSFESINSAPADGWSPSRSVEAILNHCYIVRLREDDHKLHYAKIYIVDITSDFVTFEWAYQTAPENRDLAPPAPGRGTGGHSSAYRNGAPPGLNTEAKLANRFSDPPIVERVTWTWDFELGQRTTM
jgi:hypothetical protein